MSLSRHRREADEELREDGDSDNLLPEAGRTENSEESTEMTSTPLLADDNEKKQASSKQEVRYVALSTFCVSVLCSLRQPSAPPTPSTCHVT